MTMTRIAASLLFLCVTVTIAQAQLPQAALDSTNESATLLAPYRAQAVERWEQDIRKLEAKDQNETHPPSSILFVGSSSIRLWKTIAEDVAPYHPIQRGYGGAKFSDVAVFAERLVHPHQYRAMVVFVANDISGSKNDFTVDQVDPLVRHVIHVSHQHQPNAPVMLIEITPTSSRWATWPTIRQLNARLREIALTTPHTFFIPTADHYLHPTQIRPRDELFVDDKLHLNREGYRIWGQIVRQRLDATLRLEEINSSFQSLRPAP